MTAAMTVVEKGRDAQWAARLSISNESFILKMQLIGHTTFEIFTAGDKKISFLHLFDFDPQCISSRRPQTYKQGRMARAAAATTIKHGITHGGLKLCNLEREGEK